MVFASHLTLPTMASLVLLCWVSHKVSHAGVFFGNQLSTLCPLVEVHAGLRGALVSLTLCQWAFGLRLIFAVLNTAIGTHTLVPSPGLLAWWAA